MSSTVACLLLFCKACVLVVSVAFSAAVFGVLPGLLLCMSCSSNSVFMYLSPRVMSMY